MRINLDNGKYTYVFENGQQQALRHNEPWRDLTGDNLIYHMACRITELNDECEKAKDYMIELSRHANSESARAFHYEKQLLPHPLETESTDNTIRQMILSSPEKVRELLLTNAARNAVMRVHVNGEKGMLSRDYSLLYGGSIHLNSVMLKTLWTKGYLTREEVSSRSGGIQHLYKVNEELGL